MSEFTGMALYTKEEIGRALDSYGKELDYLEKLLSDKVLEAEYSFKPSWLDKLFGVKCLKDKKPSFSVYKSWLYKEGYISFTKEDEIRLDDFNRYQNMYYLGEWLYENEYWQVKNLYNGGKDCYLNPNQASFVNKWKVK